MLQLTMLVRKDGSKITTMAWTIVFILFEITGVFSLLTMNNKEKDSKCPRVSSHKISLDLDELMRRAASIRKHKYYDPGPIGDKFFFSKLGCQVSDKRCPCFDRRHKFHWAPVTILGGGGDIDQHLPASPMPWMFYLKASTGITCVGFLVSYQFGLTAGQCLEGAAYINVTLGVNSLDKVKEEGGLSLTISNTHFFINPQYTKTKRYHNIGLIVIANGPNAIHAFRHPNIAPACLSHHRLVPNLRCFGPGWGMMRDPAKTEYPKTLRWERLILIDFFGETIFTKTMDKNNPSVLCENDSGSPLMCMDDAGIARVYGLFIKGPKAACDKIPQRYQRILMHTNLLDERARKWLSDKMKEESEKASFIFDVEKVANDMFTSIGLDIVGANKSHPRAFFRRPKLES